MQKLKTQERKKLIKYIHVRRKYQINRNVNINKSITILLSTNDTNKLFFLQRTRKPTTQIIIILKVKERKTRKEEKCERNDELFMSKLQLYFTYVCTNVRKSKIPNAKLYHYICYNIYILLYTAHKTFAAFGIYCRK